MLIHELDWPKKLLATSFIVVLSCGFFAAHALLHYTFSQSSGKESLVPGTPEIVKHFYGDREQTRFRKMVLGPMKKYFTENPDEQPKGQAKLTASEQADLDKVVAWNDRGAPEAEYWDTATKKHIEIGAILNSHGCFECHAVDARGTEAKADAPLETFAGISKFTKQDTGLGEGQLLMLTHVHLLGMGLMFLGLSAFFAFTAWPAWLRGWLIFAGFASILLDISGWWMVKGQGAPWAWLVILGGILMGVAFGAIALLTIVGTWRKPKAVPAAPAA